MKSDCKVAGITARQRGFTLLEVLVALVVLALVLGGLAQGSQFGLRIADRQSAAIASAGDMDAADRLLRRVIEQAYPGTSTSAPFLAAGPSSLGFTANLAVASPGLFSGDADVSIGVTADRRLVLRWTPHLHATPLAPSPAPQEATLLPGVQRVEFGYWGGEGSWLAAWTERTLPPLIRIRLIFPPGGRAAWPDIIVEPMRKRLNG